MRCVDADALIKAIVRKEPFSDCARVVIAECMEEVRHAPTIEPEREKGEWVKDSLCTTSGGTYAVRRCSLCESYYHDVVFTWNFCPNCGARMER